MKKVYVLVFDGLADWEIGLISYELNSRNGIPVETVGWDLEPVRTGGGLRILPDGVLSDIRPEGTALLILPGGEMWHGPFDQELGELVLRLHAAGVPVGAICGATVFLARSGLLKADIQHTSNSLAYLQEMAPEYGDEAYYREAYAVSDQGVITAGGLASVEFAYHILKTLGVYDEGVLAEFAEFWNCRGV